MEPEQTISHTPKQLMILNKFRKRLEREKYVNNYASNYYGTLQSKFTIPGILITGICSVASFMATSDMLTDGTKAGFSVGVGILTAGATILQSVSSSFGFGARKDAFQKSADSYDDLITKIEFEIYNPNERFADFCNDLEEAILKIKNDCNFLPPLFVMAKYEEEMKKAHLKLDSDGSPSKDGSIFGDMLDKLNNYPSVISPPVIKADNTPMTTSPLMVPAELEAVSIPFTQNSKPTPDGREIRVTSLPLHWDDSSVHTVHDTLDDPLPTIPLVINAGTTEPASIIDISTGAGTQTDV